MTTSRNDGFEAVCTGYYGLFCLFLPFLCDSKLISLFRCLNSELWSIKKESVGGWGADCSWSALSSLGLALLVWFGSDPALMDGSLRFTSARGTMSDSSCYTLLNMNYNLLIVLVIFLLFKSLSLMFYFDLL